MFLLCIASLVLLEALPSTSAPILMEMVDMTYTFDETTLHWPAQKKFRKRVTHNGTTDQGYWLMEEEYTSATHVGTHIDAPCHFSPRTWCIDEIPLERLVAPAAVVDITDKASLDPDALVESEDLQLWEQISGKSLNKSVVVMRSGWGRRWNNREAFIGTSSENDMENMHFPGMSPKAAKWLVDNRDVYGVASETLSLDSGESKELKSHQILLEANIYGLENVANVEDIPIVGALLHVMPMKIGKSSGAPVRIIATYPKMVFKPKDERSLREVIIFS